MTATRDAGTDPVPPSSEVETHPLLTLVCSHCPAWPGICRRCGSSRRSLENPGSRNPSPRARSRSRARTRRSAPGWPGRAGVRGAGGREPLPPLLLRIGRQAPLQGAVGRRRHPRLLKNPQGVQLARRLDDPGQHQVPEDLVPARRVFEPQHPVGALQGVNQVAHPQGSDRQRPGRRRTARRIRRVFYLTICRILNLYAPSKVKRIRRSADYTHIALTTHCHAAYGARIDRFGADRVGLPRNVRTYSVSATS